MSEGKIWRVTALAVALLLGLAQFNSAAGSIKSPSKAGSANVSERAALNLLFGRAYTAAYETDLRELLKFPQVPGRSSVTKDELPAAIVAVRAPNASLREGLVLLAAAWEAAPRTELSSGQQALGDALLRSLTTSGSLQRASSLPLPTYVAGSQVAVGPLDILDAVLNAAGSLGSATVTFAVDSVAAFGSVLAGAISTAAAFAGCVGEDGPVAGALCAAAALRVGALDAIKDGISGIDEASQEYLSAIADAYFTFFEEVSAYQNPAVQQGRYCAEAVANYAQYPNSYTMYMVQYYCSG